MQRLVTPQHGRVSEAFRAHQHRDQKGYESGRRLDLIRGLPLDRHVPPQLPHKIDLLQKRKEDGHAAERSYRPFGFSQNQPLAR